MGRPERLYGDVEARARVLEFFFEKMCTLASTRIGKLLGRLGPTPLPRREEAPLSAGVVGDRRQVPSPTYPLCRAISVDVCAGCRLEPQENIANDVILSISCVFSMATGRHGMERDVKLLAMISKCSKEKRLSPLVACGCQK
eukprot:gb/GEZJ01000748.1/.p1 GENE.gb/GEZJ01000748.1/~~gb/GEZJ01000748.1/.p1  ORF type:complete len:142 (+),score=16.77 gb/GEZJ01000748.1/:3-428(+)